MKINLLSLSIFISFFLHTLILSLPLKLSNYNESLRDLKKSAETLIELLNPDQLVISNQKKHFRNRKTELLTNKLLKDYSLKLEQKIHSQLYIPSSLKDQKGNLYSVVQIEINKDGSLNRIALKRRSSSEILDNIVISAIERSAPFPPLPFSINHLKVELPLRFVVKKNI